MSNSTPSNSTPGPWLREGTTVYALADHIVDGRQIFRNGEPQKVNRFYCHVVYQKVGGGTELEADANARLISAAPELLEACKAIDELDDGNEPFAWKHESLFKRLHTAIAKATGGAQ